MSSLFLKDEYVETSPPVVGYRMLKQLGKKGVDKISIFDLADCFKNEPWFSPKALYYGMIFLFALGLIEFNEPYVIKNVSN